MRKVTFREVSELSFNLLLPDGEYRTFDGGILATDEEDPFFDWLLAWAETQPTVTVFLDGQTLQQGNALCEVCGRPVPPGEKEAAAHAKQYHIDNGEQEEPGPFVRKPKPRPRRRA